MPETIPFSSVILDDRTRQDYRHIDALAESIEGRGLIQPIVLEPLSNGTYKLHAGGRRYQALERLGTETLYHATTSDIGRPGFVLTGEKSPLEALMVELGENLDRQSMTWQEELVAITKAWRLIQSEAHASGEKVFMRDFGTILGCGYHKLQVADQVYDLFISHPELFESCTTIRQCFQVLARHRADEISRVYAERVMGAKLEEPEVKAPDGPGPEGESPETRPKLHLELSKLFHQTDGIEHLNLIPPETYDHIVCDPDYAIAAGQLDSRNSDSYDTGIYQDSVEASLSDLQALITAAYSACRYFFIFHYDLEHHEKCRKFAESVGFRVQHWPVIWHKVGFSSNGAPNHNFPKNYEVAMICAKENSLLANVQKTSIYAEIASSSVAKRFGHPFAKPPGWWKFLYSAIAIKGQSVHDPCVGSGSSIIPGLDLGLRMSGCEIQPKHYNTLLQNIHGHFADTHQNHDVTFS